MQLNHIYQGDSLSVLSTLADQSIHTCITSPPYWGLRDYGVEGQLGLESTPEEYVAHMVDVFREVRRVLRDDGTLWLNLGISYQNKQVVAIPWMVALALQQDGWYLRSDIIWEKPNAMPSSVKDRPSTSHEYIFLLSKSAKYYYDNESIKEPAVNGDPTSPRGSKGVRGSKNSGIRKQDAVGNRTYTGFNDRYEPLAKRNKRSVWHVSTKPFREAHFATFPPDLIEPCVLAGSPVGGVVLDPFFGSGTTGLVALQNGRNYVGIELNPDYIEIAKRRLDNVQCKAL